MHSLVCALDGKEMQAIEHLQYVGEVEGRAVINCRQIEAGNTCNSSCESINQSAIANQNTHSKLKHFAHQCEQ